MNQTINDTGIKRAALINDLSCIGKCSLSVALPIVSARCRRPCFRRIRAGLRATSCAT